MIQSGEISGDRQRSQNFKGRATAPTDLTLITLNNEALWSLNIFIIKRLMVFWDKSCERRG
jgi:hypothetical protein